MAIGCIEGYGAEGVLEGWATDPVRPLAGLAIAILDSERNEIASGFAHLYRADLAAAEIGFGWCGFQLVASRALDPVGAELTLVEQRSRDVLFGPQFVAKKPGRLRAQKSIADVIGSDPTVLASIDHLRPCRAAFADSIADKGLTTFIRLAYVYLLQRPVDSNALANFEKRVGNGELEPFAMLKSISDSDEFKSRRRNLPAPTSIGFPFKTA